MSNGPSETLTGKISLKVYAGPPPFPFQSMATPKIIFTLKTNSRGWILNQRLTCNLPPIMVYYVERCYQKRLPIGMKIIARLYMRMYERKHTLMEFITFVCFKFRFNFHSFAFAKHSFIKATLPDFAFSLSESSHRYVKIPLYWSEYIHSEVQYQQ